MSENPLRAVLTMTVQPTDAEEFEKEWETVAAWVQIQPGCRRQTLCRQVADEQVTYLITSDWAGPDAFHGFETSSRQDDATAGLRRLRTSVHMQISEIIDHRG